MSDRVLVTGASGRVGTLLRPRLARANRVLRLVDVRDPEPIDGVGPEEIVAASITDLGAMTDAAAAVDAIVHLAGMAVESDFETVARLNALGSRNVLEAARRAGVSRVMLASSYHAAGFADRNAAPPEGLSVKSPARPDTWYGWSKVATEAAGQLYADRFDMSIACPRSGNWVAVPQSVRALPVWLSPDDGARMVEACLTAGPGFHLFWGISRNTRRWFSLAEGEAIGYHPMDDSEQYASALIAEHGEPNDCDPEQWRAGGPWCEVPLGEAMGTRPARGGK